MKCLYFGLSFSVETQKGKQIIPDKIRVGAYVLIVNYILLRLGVAFIPQNINKKDH